MSGVAVGKVEVFFSRWTARKTLSFTEGNFLPLRCLASCVESETFHNQRVTTVRRLAHPLQTVGVTIGLIPLMLSFDARVLAGMAELLLYGSGRSIARN
jgi:hypothetical protein